MAGNALKVEDASWDSEVMKAPELVMVDFWAVWCGPCQMVAPIVDELANEYAGKVKVFVLNTDENPEVAGRYQAETSDDSLLQNGQVVEKLVGARPKRQFKEMIDQLWRNTPAPPNGIVNSLISPAQPRRAKTRLAPRQPVSGAEGENHVD